MKERKKENVNNKMGKESVCIYLCEKKRKHGNAYDKDNDYKSIVPVDFVGRCHVPSYEFNITAHIFCNA